MRHYQKILGCTAALALSVSLVGCAAEGTPVLTVAAATVETAAVSDGVTIRFTNTSVTASEAGNPEIDGTSVSITGAGTYILSGSCGSGEDTRDQGSRFGFGGSSFLSEGSAFAVTDSQGNSLCSGEAKCNTSFLLFSSDALTADETYTLSGGSSQQTAQAQSGTVKSGMGGMGGMGGGPGDSGQRPENFDPSRKPDKGSFDPGSKPEGQPPEPSQDGESQ